MLYDLLTEGALEKIMSGINVEKPILQILVKQKLRDTLNEDGFANDCYRLLMSDGQRLNSSIMLDTRLNYLVTDDILNDCAICRILNYQVHLSTMNNSVEKRDVMLILGIKVLVSGSEIGCLIRRPRP